MSYCLIALQFCTEVQSQYNNTYECMLGEYGSYSQIGAIKGKYDQIMLNRGNIAPT